MKDKAIPPVPYGSAEWHPDKTTYQYLLDGKLFDGSVEARHYLESLGFSWSDAVGYMALLCHEVMWH